MNESVDVIIIGSGTAGLAALREVRKRTERLVLINDGPYGTTCARVGCMPSKVLVEAANAYHRRQSFEAFGIRGGDRLSVDVPAVLRRVRSLRDGFVAGTLEATDDIGERNIPGRARLVGPDRVEVAGRIISARRIVIATGSRPIVPSAWTSLGDRVLTTDTLFEQSDLPRRIAVIGMGAIGVEMAQALSRLGLEVTGFDLATRLAGLSDNAVNDALIDLLRKEFPIHLGAPAALSALPEALEVRSGNRAVVVDRVLAALGRRPNVDGMGLESLGVSLDERGMPPVDTTTMQVGDLPVFLAGDANEHAAVLHEAADEGHIAGINATADEVVCFKRRTPLGIVFCDPGAAFVGRRSAELDDATTVVGEVNFERQGRARAAQRNRGVMRIYAESPGGRLLGAEMCAPAAEHMAHLLALAIEREVTVADLLRMPFYHPVLEEGMRTALRNLARQLPPSGESDLASCEAFRIEALD
ncbi:MAG: dihydrolipoyl dehydrogenase [Hyphomicrobium sp.]